MHYQDCRNKFDTQSLLLHGEQRDQKLTAKLCSMSIDADPRANSSLTATDLASILRLPAVIARQALVERHKQLGDGKALQQARKALRAEKDKAKRHLLVTRRQQFWESRDAQVINQQADGSIPDAVPEQSPMSFSFPERELIANLRIETDMRSPAMLQQCITATEALVNLCRRNNGGRPSVRQKECHTPGLNAIPAVTQSTDYTPLFDERQCFICIHDETLPEHDRFFTFSRLDKLWDHVRHRHSRILN